ncbi:hypothetical protein AB1Y20_020774 [Prymnesium parvum]|uniref:Uncharacterized protein n=1 Tax=Prymnesium parvum TaxID=97485 RepID=A0AB34JUY2_PRYPA
MGCPCADCQCGEDCQCAPGAPGCDPCGRFQQAKQEAAASADPAPDAPPAPLLALPSPEDVSRKIDLDVTTGQAVVLDRLGPVVVNTDGTLSRVSNWEELSAQEQEATKRRISKRNVERLRAFRDAGELKGEVVSALQPSEP